MTATHDTTTTSQELLDELVEQGYPADNVTTTIERMAALGCIEHKPADEELELILTDDEARVIRHTVTGAPLHEPTPLPCPTWCTAPAGHGFDSHDTGAGDLWRCHTRALTPDVAPFSVELVSTETAVTNSGPVVDASPVEVSVYVDGDAVTASQARELAAALDLAADAWDVANA